MPLFEGRNRGVVVGSAGEPAPLPVFLQAFHASGQPLTNGVSETIPQGKNLTYDVALQPFYLERPSRITIRATAEEAPDQSAEVLAETYPDQWAMFGGNLTNPLPEPMQINALEAQTDHPLCPDHRRFLKYLPKRAAEHLPEIGLLAAAQYLFGAGAGHPYLNPF